MSKGHKRSPQATQRQVVRWFIAQRENRNHPFNATECDRDFALYEYIQHLVRELRDDRDLKADFDTCARLAETVCAKQDAAARQNLFTLFGWRWLRPVYAIPLTLVVLLGALWVLMAVLMKPQLTVYQTAFGERREIVLPDLSTATLNTNTLLSVDYSEHARRLSVARGEAVFDVMPNGAVPFEVQAGNGVVTAVGTEFSVVVESSEVVVSVLEGIVNIERTLAETAIPAIKNRGSGDGDSDEVEARAARSRLKSGESLTYWDNGAVAEIVAADTKRIEAWRSGKAVFRTLRLADAVAEHNRYSRRKIVIGSDGIENLWVSGAFVVGDTDSLIFLLENSMGLSARRQADGVVLENKKGG